VNLDYHIEIAKHFYSVPLARARSGQRERVFMITGIGVHDPTDWPFTITGMRNRQQFEWQFLYLGSSEETVDALAHRAKMAVPLGQRVRIMELTADAGSGMGVFEQLPSKYANRPDMFADALKDAVADYYGAPADAFLERLVHDVRRNRQNLISSIDRRMTYFLSKLGSETRSGPMSRMAKYFALVYAAGRLANHYDVLPWKRRDMFQAVTKCHQRLIVPPEFSNPHTPQRSITTVRDYIRRLKGTFINLDTHSGPLTKRDLADAAGIVHKRRGGEPEYLFAPLRFDSHVCGELASEAVFQHLKNADLLYQHTGGKRTVPRDFPNPLGRDRVIAVKSEILKRK
jgi:putative DNA primase/helicase